MSYTVIDLKSDLNSILKGTTTDKIPNILGVINRSARQVLLDIDPAETARTQSITNSIYDSVYDYTLPSDLKGNKIIDIRPQVSRNEKFTRRNIEDFDFDKENDTFTIRHNGGVKTIRLVKSIASPIVLSTCNSLTTEGTWSASGVGTNLTSDDNNYISGSGSLNFDSSAAGTAILSVTLTNSVDLTDEEDKSAIFAYVYMPESSYVTSAVLRWGSDSSNYWQATVTTAQDGAFKDGWNLIRFDWNGATKVLIPTVAAVDYIYFGLVVTAVDTDFRLDSITCNIGEIFEIEYYSKYIFSDGTTSLWKETAVANEDIINLDTDSYNILLNKTAEFCCQTVKTLNNDVKYFNDIYNQSVERYIADNKSQSKNLVSTYYTLYKR